MNVFSLENNHMNYRNNQHEHRNQLLLRRSDFNCHLLPIKYSSFFGQEYIELHTISVSLISANTRSSRVCHRKESTFLKKRFQTKSERLHWFVSLVEFKNGCVVYQNKHPLRNKLLPLSYTHKDAVSCHRSFST